MRIEFIKSRKAQIDFPVDWEIENSLYGCFQEIVRGFVRIDGKCYPAVAEVYPSAFETMDSKETFDFVRSIQMDGVTLSFSTRGNCFVGPLWLCEAECEYLS